MILCCTGLLDGTARRLRVHTGTLAALCPLLAAASAFSFGAGSVFRINPAVVLLLCCCLLLCRNATACALSQLLAACMGACGFALCRVFETFYEPGILIALPAAAAAAILLPHRRAALLCAISAPMYYVLCIALETYYLFHAVLLDFAATEVLDAQTAACAFLFFFWRLPKMLPKLVAKKRVASAK